MQIRRTQYGQSTNEMKYVRNTVEPVQCEPDISLRRLQDGCCVLPSPEKDCRIEIRKKFVAKIGLYHRATECIAAIAG